MTTNDKPTNEHLKTYINYYTCLDNPKYAVLVKGEWGVGKTHLIKNILKEDQRFYVSLFGLTTIQEVHSAVFVKMYPNRSRFKSFFNWFGNSSMKANDITLALGPLVGNIANALIKERVDNSKPIIFDDLERCNINREDLFGAINKYVEHHKCKVIIIAHDDKLNDELTDKKEKIIGQVIKVTPNIENALNQFISKSKTPRSVELIKDIIYKSFLASECKSLRILDYIINDCTRLLSCIPYNLHKNTTLLSELFTLFTALNINYRMGKLKESEINSRNTAIYYGKIDGSTSDIFDEIKEKYNNNKVLLILNSDLLSNEVLIDTISNGIYQKNKIKESIDSSRYFIQYKEKRPWLTIMNFDSHTTREIDNALEELYTQFDEMQIIETGEIQHAINLLFMLSDANHIDQTIDEIYSFFSEYVKKLQKNNKFPPADIGTRHTPTQDSAYGYGYWINDSYRHYFSKLNKILEQHKTIALKKKYPSFLADLKNNLKEDTTKFCEQISRYNKENNIYGYIAILSSFKPYEFVDIWLSLDIKKWHSVRSALVNRYSDRSLHNDLTDEQKWLQSVKMNIQHRESKASGIDKLRLSRLLIGL
ncbi:P-loop NTPase fold protein [Edwardsiella piscicida]|uniref:P-loop NTPase fold protein n=1 Tax=Edwardsiella piscicida TaxID=1263550 RepID=UPI00370D04E0